MVVINRLREVVTEKGQYKLNILSVNNTFDLFYVLFGFVYDV